MSKGNPPRMTWSRHNLNMTPILARREEITTNEIELQQQPHPQKIELPGTSRSTGIYSVIASSTNGFGERDISSDQNQKMKTEQITVGGDDKSSPKGKQKPPVQGRGPSSAQNNQFVKKKWNQSTESSEANLAGAILENVGGGHLIAEMPVIPEPVLMAEDFTPRYVQAYMDLQYISCMSPYDRNQKAVRDRASCELALFIIQKIIFSYIVILSTLSSFFIAKFSVVKFFAYLGIDDLMDIGYYMIFGFIQVHGTYFLIFRQKDITHMLKTWENYEANTAPNSDSKKRMKLYCILLCYGLSSILRCILKPILYTQKLPLKVGKLVLENSEELAEGLFMWTPDHYKNSTDIKENYGKNLTITAYIFGAFNFQMDICQNIQIEVVCDLLVFMSHANKYHVMHLMEKVQECLRLKKTDASSSLEKDVECWKLYRETKTVNKLTNKMFEAMLKLFHFRNFFLFAVLFDLTLSGDMTFLDAMFFVYDFAKVVYIYYQARKTSNQNGTLQKWLRSLPCYTKRFCVGNIIYRRYVMLNELKQEPMGLGFGNFHINGDFLYKFGGISFSLLCIYVNARLKSPVK